MSIQNNVPVEEQFLASLDKHGGTLTSSQVQNIDITNSILLNICGDIHLPCFQFKLVADKEPHLPLKIVMNPLIEHTLVELRKRTNYSGIRLCNFFTVEREYPGIDDKISLIKLFKTDMTLEQQMYLDMLIQNAGTNNLL